MVGGTLQGAGPVQVASLDLGGFICVLAVLIFVNCCKHLSLGWVLVVLRGIR